MTIVRLPIFEYNTKISFEGKSRNMNGFAYYRKRTGLSQTAVADILGIDQTTVSRWECGKKLPRSSKLCAIANLYHCQIEDLFSVFEDN